MDDLAIPIRIAVTRCTGDFFYCMSCGGYQDAHTIAVDSLLHERTTFEITLCGDCLTYLSGVIDTRLGGPPSHG